MTEVICVKGKNFEALYIDNKFVHAQKSIDPNYWMYFLGNLNQCFCAVEYNSYSWNWEDKYNFPIKLKEIRKLVK